MGKVPLWSAPFQGASKPLRSSEGFCNPLRTDTWETHPCELDRCGNCLARKAGQDVAQAALICSRAAV